MATDLSVGKASGRESVRRPASSCTIFSPRGLGVKVTKHLIIFFRSRIVLSPRQIAWLIVFVAMEKVCPRCRRRFTCLHESIMDCHCTRISLDAALRAFIAENYDGCLCSECLHTIKDSFYLYGTNPIYRYHVQPNPHVCSRK